MSEKKDIHTIHDDKLIEFIENLGLKRKFDTGNLSCKFCDRTINFENLNSIFPESGAIKFTCNSPECILQLSDYLNDHGF